MKWEYLVIFLQINIDDKDLLSELGNKGWELITIIPEDQLAYLKRPKEMLLPQSFNEAVAGYFGGKVG